MISICWMYGVQSDRMYWSVGNKKFYKHETKHTRKKLINFIFLTFMKKHMQREKTCRQTIYILNTRFTTSAILINVVINCCLSIFGCFMEILVEIYEKANMYTGWFFRANFLLNDRWSLNFCLQRTFNRLIIFFSSPCLLVLAVVSLLQSTKNAWLPRYCKPVKPSICYHTFRVTREHNMKRRM